jgi:copper chaperone NosL
MTIVDQQHGAEAVSDKGKVFKFDAIECMVQYTAEKNHRNYALLLVNNYVEKGTLIDAKTSTFLISEAIPSPMGAFLSAFATEKEAEEIRSNKGGELFIWNELPKAITQKPPLTSNNKTSY